MTTNMKFPGVQTLFQQQIFGGAEGLTIEPSGHINRVAAHVINSPTQPIDVVLDDRLLVT